MGSVGGHAGSSASFLLLSSDVLCPSVRVEGDRFKHTNGGTREITGERGSLSAAFAGPELSPPGAGLASMILRLLLLPSTKDLTGRSERHRWQLPSTNPTVRKCRCLLWGSAVALWDSLRTALA